MPKSEKRQKNIIIQLRCTEDEAEALRSKARTAGISTSELLRRSALNRKIMVRTDLKLMNELLRLGGLQKHLYNEMRDKMTTDLSHQFSDVLVEIKRAIIALDLNNVPVGETNK
ncbi:plasmid mobilization protein MobA [Erwinia rhapontici]|uniref:plasmid mobilization protein MobA n=1 Tax=Erwinia rhapontici TaxID=55212 RepID=UPI0013313E58|nr:plasmid mobilization protein MobA [Erwinia rhapontici]MBP2157377.1 hypothetical protein [Erwinia rhapontici]